MRKEAGKEAGSHVFQVKAWQAAPAIRHQLVPSLVSRLLLILAQQRSLIFVCDVAVTTCNQMQSFLMYCVLGCVNFPACCGNERVCTMIPELAAVLLVSVLVGMMKHYSTRFWFLVQLSFFCASCLAWVWPPEKEPGVREYSVRHLRLL